MQTSISLGISGIFGDKRFLLVTVIILLLVLGTVTLLNANEISTLISSWLEGRPRMLVKLKIRLPQVGCH